MVEEVDSYVDDETIAALIFDDAEVPGNAISRNKNNVIKRRVKETLHKRIGKKRNDPLVEDEHGILEGISIKLYDKIYHGEDPDFDQTDLDDLQAYGYIGIPLEQTDQRTGRVID